MTILRARALVVALLVVLFVAPSVVSGEGGPDAGTGMDAGETVSTALGLAAPGTYVGSTTERDEDWFRLEQASSAPRCVSMRVESSMRGHAGLSLVSADRTRTVRTPLRDGDAVYGIAAPTLREVLMQVRRTGSDEELLAYDLHAQVLGVADATNGDASTLRDTGGVPSTAIEAPRGCFTGVVGDRLLADSVDLFRIPVNADEPVYYSVAGAGLSATLVDAAGNAVGPEIASGGLAGAVPPTGGEYFLRLSTSSPSAAPYAVGLIVGPPDPGSGCRPMCIL